MFGAYFSDTGARIQQGAGSYFEGPGAPPVAKSFKDGVFGEQLDETSPGKLQSYQDGSLGSLGYPLFVNGRQTDGPLTITHGASGGEGGDGGVLGPGAAETGGPSPETTGGPLTAFRDGILGAPPYPQGMPGPLMARREGALGALGVVEAGGATLDMTDATTVKEVKAILALAVPELTMVEGPEKEKYNEDFFASAIWGSTASQLMASFTIAAVSEAGGQLSPEQVQSVSGQGIYPTPMGIHLMLMRSGQLSNPEVMQQFPKVVGFYQKMMAAGLNFAKFKVTAPYFSEEERVSGEGFKLSKYALIGLGAVAVVGAVLVVRKRRR